MRRPRIKRKNEKTILFRINQPRHIPEQQLALNQREPAFIDGFLSIQGMPAHAPVYAAQAFRVGDIPGNQIELSDTPHNAGTDYRERVRFVRFGNVFVCTAKTGRPTLPGWEEMIQGRRLLPCDLWESQMAQEDLTNT